MTHRKDGPLHAPLASASLTVPAWDEFPLVHHDLPGLGLLLSLSGPSRVLHLAEDRPVAEADLPALLSAAQLLGADIEASAASMWCMLQALSASGMSAGWSLVARPVSGLPPFVGVGRAPRLALVGGALSCDAAEAVPELSEAFGLVSMLFERSQMEVYRTLALLSEHAVGAHLGALILRACTSEAQLQDPERHLAPMFIASFAAAREDLAAGVAALPSSLAADGLGLLERRQFVAWLRLEATQAHAQFPGTFGVVLGALDLMLEMDITPASEIGASMLFEFAGLGPLR